MQNFNNAFDWDLARVFLAVAREGQLLGAAKKLDLDHATVTRRINTLEAALGLRLLERSTTGSQLTAAGLDFLDHVMRIESEFLAASASLTKDADTATGTVRIGAPDGFGTLFLAGRFAPLLSQNPRLTVQLVPLPRSFSLSKREADIVVTVERPVAGRLRVRKLTDYALSFYAAPSYLEHAPPLRSKDDLPNHRLIAYVADLLFSSALDFSSELGLTAVPQFQCASVLGQMEAVRSGLGVGLLHDYAVPHDGSLVQVLPDVTLQRAYWLVTHASGADTRSVRTVHDFLVKTVSEATGTFMAAKRKKLRSL
jgi:DNA-binding transcriptional LysR family regulator